MSDPVSAGSLRDSLRELLQRGLDGRGGLDRLAERIRRLRAEARRRGDLGGTLDQVRAALDQALAAEEETLAGMEGDDARLAELELAALPDDTAGAVRALKDMLADLNDLLAAHARGEDTEDRFREFMDRHGDLFPEQPENVDELIDALARRQAAADRMMASLSPE